jgi:hypothetical protein
VAPGNHTIEVRNGAFKSMTAELTVGQGEEFAVEHNFIARAPPKAPVKSATKALPPKPRPQVQARRGVQDEKGFWDRFVDWFKGQERKAPDDRNPN